ncbi:ornithine cyclodeaminase family protein [Actinoallomurus soli]|uniref:ornithine cyclodeaminase family protein n=1 Tax=Actinoallomurus soli TaxID=2952535 RepID=UPI0020933293|nr:ornithine cyclodeaminase family protein [Actinoallomurus soli]MCO5974330.1 ornithine cyclodeaminase family protein [Actinoallomurus soli]
MTVLFSRSDLETLLDPRACLDALRAGFLASSGPVRPQRVRTDLPGPGTATALIPGLIEGVPAYTVKVNAKFPDATPALRGVVCLHDLRTGELLALLDSATVTAWRTGLAAALGTDALARPDADTVAVIGAGAQADLVVTGLRRLRPIRELVVTDISPERAAAFAARHGGRAVPTRAGQGVPSGVAEAGIIVTATWARTPLLHAGDVGAGAHVTSLGADEPGKAEISADLLRASRTFVDDLDLAVAMGALGNAGLGREHAAGVLADVLRGVAPGRTDPSEVTVYAPVGLPWQDLALSWAAYRAAGPARRFDFLG